MSLPKLEEWELVPTRKILARLYNDPRYVDGSLMATSEIILLDEVNNIVVTQGVTYELGKKYGA